MTSDRRLYSKNCKTKKIAFYDTGCLKINNRSATISGTKDSLFYVNFFLSFLCIFFLLRKEKKNIMGPQDVEESLRGPFLHMFI